MVDGKPCVITTSRLSLSWLDLNEARSSLALYSMDSTDNGSGEYGKLGGLERRLERDGSVKGVVWSGRRSLLVTIGSDDERELPSLVGDCPVVLRRQDWARASERDATLALLSTLFKGRVLGSFVCGGHLCFRNASWSRGHGETRSEAYLLEIKVTENQALTVSVRTLASLAMPKHIRVGHWPIERRPRYRLNDDASVTAVDGFRDDPSLFVPGKVFWSTKNTVTDLSFESLAGYLGSKQCIEAELVSAFNRHIPFASLAFSRLEGHYVSGPRAHPGANGRMLARMIDGREVVVASDGSVVAAPLVRQLADALALTGIRVRVGEPRRDAWNVVVVDDLPKNAVGHVSERSVVAGWVEQRVSASTVERCATGHVDDHVTGPRRSLKPSPEIFSIVNELSFKQDLVSGRMLCPEDVADLGVATIELALVARGRTAAGNDTERLCVLEIDETGALRTRSYGPSGVSEGDRELMDALSYSALTSTPTLAIRYDHSTIDLVEETDLRGVVDAHEELLGRLVNERMDRRQATVNGLFGSKLDFRWAADPLITRAVLFTSSQRSTGLQRELRGTPIRRIVSLGSDAPRIDVIERLVNARRGRYIREVAYPYPIKHLREYARALGLEP